MPVMPMAGHLRGSVLAKVVPRVHAMPAHPWSTAPRSGPFAAG